MDQLYREQLMEYYKNPLNRGKIDDPSTEVTKKNPLCGDVISLQLKIEGNKIKDAKFDGAACAVSIASSSLVTDVLKGKSLDEAKKITKEEVLDMLGVELTTSRVKCASLVLEALRGALEGYEEK